MGNENTILEVNCLSHGFPLTKNMHVRAVDDVSFSVRRGEILGLIGESGSGKSTLARCIMNIYEPNAGSILFNGIDICDSRQRNSNKKYLQKKRQMIFQDSSSSLDQRVKVMHIVTEPMRIHHIAPPRGSFRKEAEYQLHYVGMGAEYLDKYPPELSSGMRQRVAIARALSMAPELLVADEPIASLDVSIQAQIINLFKHLQRQHGFTFLFIAHDLSVVKYLCDRVCVMYRGKIVEIAPTQELFINPLHPYTRALLSAIPIPDPRLERMRILEPFSEDNCPCTGELKEPFSEHFVLVPEGGLPS